jgi:hypothetical protein
MAEQLGPLLGVGDRAPDFDLPAADREAASRSPPCFRSRRPPTDQSIAPTVCRPSSGHRR